MRRWRPLRAVPPVRAAGGHLVPECQTAAAVGCRHLRWTRRHRWGRPARTSRREVHVRVHAMTEDAIAYAVSQRLETDARDSRGSVDALVALTDEGVVDRGVRPASVGLRQLDERSKRCRCARTATPAS